MGQLIVNAPRWLLLATLAYAPWAYGATRQWAIVGLNYLLGAMLGLWLVSYLLRQGWPSVHPVLAVSALGLAAQAWFMVINAKYDYDNARHEFIPLTPLLSRAPGSLHRSLSATKAVQLSAILAAVCVVCDLARSAVWRKRLLLTLALTGTSVVLLGLAQRLSNASSVFWGPENMGKTFFATYRYHANAGAFMNLVWPIVAGFVVLAFLRGSALWKKILWTMALVLCLAGVIANTSRAAGALGFLSAALWVGWLTCQLVRGRLEGFTGASVVVTALLVVVLVVAVAALAGLDTTLKRWGQFDREVTDQNGRLLVARVCLDMIPVAGWWGFGPGTFETTFPYFTQAFGNKLDGRWLYAHQDYLQTLIEWGYIGACCWAVLVFGAVFYSLFRALRRRRHRHHDPHQRQRDRERLLPSARVTHFALLVALAGVLLHALVDFPLQIASIQLYVAVVLGLLWGSQHWLGESALSRRLQPRRKSAPARATVPVTFKPYKPPPEQAA